MTALLLSPHNDDETLFAAYTCLREHPHVIVCTYPWVQENEQGYVDVTAEVRIAETDAAMRTLGCEWEQWLHHDRVWPTFPHVAFTHDMEALAARGYTHVYAPASEEGGHYHHNLVGEVADQVFGADNVTHYTTYVNGRGRVPGSSVAVDDNAWVLLKLQALACYRSQILLDATGHHFAQALDEWYA